MVSRLTQRELADHPIEETQRLYARRWFNDPDSVQGSFLKGVEQFMSNPGNATEFLLQDEGIQGLLSQGEAAQEAFAKARNAQRAAAAQQRNIRRKRLQMQLDTGLRDIEQGRESGLEAAVNNALQRGIYRSGIRKENEAEVERESDEAASDLKRDIDLALQSLAAQGSAQNAQFAAQDAAEQAQNAFNLGDVAALANQFGGGLDLDMPNTFTPSGSQQPASTIGSVDEFQGLVPFAEPDQGFLPQLPETKGGTATFDAIRPTGYRHSSGRPKFRTDAPRYS